MSNQHVPFHAGFLIRRIYLNPYPKKKNGHLVTSFGNFHFTTLRLLNFFCSWHYVPVDEIL